MNVKTIVYEDFANYKRPSMLIGTSRCSWKCCLEANLPLSVCQNTEIHLMETINMDDDEIVRRYIANGITEAICFGGLEPFDQFDEMLAVIKKLRTEYHCDDTIVIYTGFYKNEISQQVEALKQFKNIVIKFGRYIPEQEKHYDEVLGVWLASDNQYAERIG